MSNNNEDYPFQSSPPISQTNVWLWKFVQGVTLLGILTAIVYLTMNTNLNDYEGNDDKSPKTSIPAKEHKSQDDDQDEGRKLKPIAIGYPYVPLVASKSPVHRLDVLYVSKQSYPDKTTGLRGGTATAKFAGPIDLLAALPDEFAGRFPVIVIECVDFVGNDGLSNNNNTTTNPTILVDDEFSDINNTTTATAAATTTTTYETVGSFAQISDRRFVMYVARRNDTGNLQNSYTVLTINRELLTSRAAVNLYESNSALTRLQADLLDLNLTIVLPLQRVSMLPRSRHAVDQNTAPRPSHQRLVGHLMTLTSKDQPAQGTLLLAASRSKPTERATFVDRFLTEHRDYPSVLYTSWPTVVHTEPEEVEKVLAVLAVDHARIRHHSIRPRLRVRASTTETQRLVGTLSNYRADAVSLELL